VSTCTSCPLSPPTLERLVGRQVRAARRLAGFSQQRLSTLSGYGTTTIQRVEAGLDNPRLRTIVEIAQACGCDLRISIAPAAKPGRAETAVP
jgi:transcriptional regulator with XRE-family HTH domain